MNLVNEICTEKSNFKLHILSSFLIVLILFITSCKRPPEPYSILEFTGDDAVINYSKSLYMYAHQSDSINPTALLASDGDLIFYGDELFIYRKSPEDIFQFKTSDTGGYINGKITTLNLGNSKVVIPWFKQMKTSDLSALEFLKIDSAIPEEYYPWLTDLALLKSGIGLYHEGDLSDISRLIKLFHPRYLVGEDLSVRDLNLLSGLSNLELLFIDLDDSVSTGTLPALPALKHLFISNDRVTLNDNFLAENSTLERITINDSKSIDFSLFDPLNNLKVLIISNVDTIVNYDLIRKHTNLEVLSVIGEESDYISATDKLSGIRWMTFGQDVSQNAFNSFVNNHINLEVVEIIKNETITSLNTLMQLKNIYGLTITDTLTDLATVKSLKNLKYLSVPADVLKDKAIKDDLEKSLPGTRIVANEGFCLGSGWLLLIVPLILFFRLSTQKKSRRTNGSV